MIWIVILVISVNLIIPKVCPPPQIRKTSIQDIDFPCFSYCSTAK